MPDTTKQNNVMPKAVGILKSNPDKTKEENKKIQVISTINSKGSILTFKKKNKQTTKIKSILTKEITSHTRHFN